MIRLFKVDENGKTVYVFGEVPDKNGNMIMDVDGYYDMDMLNLNIHDNSEPCKICDEINKRRKLYKKQHKKRYPKHDDTIMTP
jgi:hypothetical protein